MKLPLMQSSPTSQHILPLFILTEHHVMKAHLGSGGIDPLIL